MNQKQSQDKKIYFVTAGGTGGHLFPAQALTEVLNAEGYEVHLVTESRTKNLHEIFPAKRIHLVSAATISPRHPLRAVLGVIKMIRGYIKARRLLRQYHCDAIIGFGGYPTIPLVLAGAHLNIPILLHEANSVLGRANKMLAKYAKNLATGFEVTKGTDGYEDKLVLTGNPVRQSVLDQVGQDYQMPVTPGQANASNEILVFGGSQGARFFSEIMPQTIANLPLSLRKSIKVTQQCRPEDLTLVTQGYSKVGISVELETFFADLPKRLVSAQLIICRSGASTIAELTALGRPAILVPLPGSIDQDQLNNAQQLIANEAGFLAEQKDLRPETLAEIIANLLEDPDKLARTAENASKLGELEATEKLAAILTTF